MKRREAKVMLIANAQGRKVQRTLHLPDATWQSVVDLQQKMPNFPTAGDLFEVLVNFARMTPGAFGLTLPAGDAPAGYWEMATWLAKGNNLSSPARLFDRLVGVAALFPERLFLDRPDESVERLIADQL